MNLPSFISLSSVGSLFFGLALLHSFVCPWFLKKSKSLDASVWKRKLFHFLGEVELVFIFWALLFCLLTAFLFPVSELQNHILSLHFTEAFFIFVVILLSSSRPVLKSVEFILLKLAWLASQITRLPLRHSQFFILLFLGPLAGSWITEPGAMTVTALLLAGLLEHPSRSFRYALLAVLFVNVSIGGSLTPFAAPPILMVVQTWSWDFHFIFQHFGWKAILAVGLNAGFFVALNFGEIRSSDRLLVSRKPRPQPMWIALLHFILLALLVWKAQRADLILVIGLTFLGLVKVSSAFQSRLRWRDSLMVSLFLAGLIFFGAFQSWWLEPLLLRLNQWTLLFGATLLTAVIDNAALTYLGSQVPQLSEAAKIHLVSGALIGGGLTLMANAPNAVGFALLQKSFPQGFEFQALLRKAWWPTLIALLCLGFL